jgi:hypothetical protein
LGSTVFLHLWTETPLDSKLWNCAGSTFVRTHQAPHLHRPLVFHILDMENPRLRMKVLSNAMANESVVDAVPPRRRSYEGLDSAADRAEAAARSTYRDRGVKRALRCGYKVARRLGNVSDTECPAQATIPIKL